MVGPTVGTTYFSARVVEDVLTLGFLLARRMGTDSGGRKGSKHCRLSKFGAKTMLQEAG